MTQQRPGRPSQYNGQPSHYDKKGMTTVNDSSYVSDVDGVQLKYRPRTPKARRMDVIRANYGFLTVAEIADRCGVSDRTIISDIHGWKVNGDFYELYEQQFYRLLNDKKAEIADSQRLQVLASIVGKCVVKGSVDFELEDKNKLNQAEMERVAKAYFNIAKQKEQNIVAQT